MLHVFCFVSNGKGLLKSYQFHFDISIKGFFNINNFSNLKLLIYGKQLSDTYYI